MKTTFKILMIFVLVAFANTLFALGNLKMNILPLKEEKAIVDIKSLTNSKLKITIEDNKRRIVYYKEANSTSDNYREVYDFSALEDGQYNLSVVSANITTKRSFKIKKGNMNVGDEKTTIKPFFGYKDGLLKFSYLNFPNDNLTLNFYNDDQLIYTKKLGYNFNIVEALNLSKLKRGNYVAILLAGENEYSYNINIH